MLRRGLCKPLPADALLDSASRRYFRVPSVLGGEGLCSFLCPSVPVIITAATAHDADSGNCFQYLPHSRATSIVPLGATGTSWAVPPTPPPCPQLWVPMPWGSSCKPLNSNNLNLLHSSWLLLPFGSLSFQFPDNSSIISPDLIFSVKKPGMILVFLPAPWYQLPGISVHVEMFPLLQPNATPSLQRHLVFTSDAI